MSIANGAYKNLTDLMFIDTANPGGLNNGPCIVGVEDASKLTNSPVKSGAFYAYRLVFPMKGEHVNDFHYLVMLFEFWPMTGRIWTAGYNKDASSWTQEWIAITRA